MHMLRQGQIKRLDGRDALGQAKFVVSLFGSPPDGDAPTSPSRLKAIPATLLEIFLADGILIPFVVPAMNMAPGLRFRELAKLVRGKDCNLARLAIRAGSLAAKADDARQ